MRKFFLNFILILIIGLCSCQFAKAVEFDVLVLPVDILSVCENYFCFPETSNIVADDVISDFGKYQSIHTKSIAYIRNVLSKNSELRNKTITVLETFKQNDKINFSLLKEIADTFGVKSVLIINSYAINDKTSLRRNLWEILEISTAFKITYPFELKTTAVLTDCVNSIVMWSGKYSKDVSDSFGYYSVSNQMQANSQLEKIKRYSSEIISKNISQNVFMRFFPKEVRTFAIKQNYADNEQAKKFVPNALEHLSDPHLLKEFESETNKNFRNFGMDDFIYQF